MSTPTPDPAPAEEAQQGGQEPPSGRRGDPEAAKYRRRLRDAQSALESARAALDEHRRTDVLRLAGDRLAQPSDVFDVARVDVDDLLDDAGLVDPARVAAAVDGLLGERPGLAAEREAPAGAYGAGKGAPTPRELTWHDAFTRKFRV